MWKYIKTLSVIYLVFCYGAVYVLAADGYFVSKEQMEQLHKEIENIQTSNINMTSKLQLQQQQYQALQTIYDSKFTSAQQQLQTYRNLYKKSESKKSLYQIGCILSGVLGLLLGVMISK